MVMWLRALVTLTKNLRSVSSTTTWWHATIHNSSFRGTWCSNFRGHQPKHSDTGNNIINLLFVCLICETGFLCVTLAIVVGLLVCLLVFVFIYLFIFQQKERTEGLGRCLASEEHCLLFQRAWLQFPESQWQLTLLVTPIPGNLARPHKHTCRENTNEQEIE